MTGRKPNGHHDPRVVPFRPRAAPPRPPRQPMKWRAPFRLFIALMVSAVFFSMVFSPPFEARDLLFAFLLAAIVTFAAFFRRGAR